jgi:putative PIN family toxin of toxin-antitoxin system
MLASIMKCVLDTSVLVAGLRSRTGASYALLQQISIERIQIAASPALFLEYEAVLKREKHGLDSGIVDEFLFDLTAKIEPVQIRFQWRPLLADSGDEMVIEAAINGHASAIVTHNRRDFERAAVRFGITVLSPAQTLEALRSER